MADETKKSKPQTIELDCPSQNVGCKNEKCVFDNQMELTTDGNVIKKITVKWTKRATTQCCKADRKQGKGTIFLTYDDGATAQITPGDYKTAKAFPPGIGWLNSDGDEIMDGAGGPDNPSGFTFDSDHAKKALKVIRIEYEMDLSCECDSKPNPTAKHWKTSMRYKAGEAEIEQMQTP